MKKVSIGPVESIVELGFVKIRNREEYLQIVPMLMEEGYSFVGRKFNTKITPFDEGYGGRKKPRKNSIYLMVYWENDKDKVKKYDKWLWLADYLDKNRISEKFPIGTPDSY